MPEVLTYKEIIEIVKDVNVIQAMEAGFIQYSNGKTVVPPVGELLFDNPKGDTHIKYGYIKQDEFFCIKIASGFYDNPKIGIPSNQGLMLLFSQKTGEPAAILLDNGCLTDIRTAAAGALVAKYFAPKQIHSIGIIGTGVQAKMQLEYLHEVTICKDVWVWGRNVEHAKKFQHELKAKFNIRIADSPSEVAYHCNLIVTTTPSENPILFAKDVKIGTHITAVGSDTGLKQELDENILQKADIVISDSIPQSKSRGEIFKAKQAGTIGQQKIIELGIAIQSPEKQRTDENQITIADLTGVAVQDIMIAQAVYRKYKKINSK